MKIEKILFLIVILNIPFIQSGVKAQDSTLQYSMKTKWSNQVNNRIPWDLYPRPQMVRNHWQNLNGMWEYNILDRAYPSPPKEFQGNILVPFAIESSLSQVKKMVGKEKFLWYKKNFKAPVINKNEKLLLHFDAVDWETVVFLNGKEIGSHKGGYDPFSFDITNYLKKGEQELIVRVWDPTDHGTQPRGKQVADPKGIWYTPVTGIWQTVWLERVPENHFTLLKSTPDIDKNSLKLEINFTKLNKNSIISVKVLANGKQIAYKSIPAGANDDKITTQINIPDPVLWSPDNPFLYDLEVELNDIQGETSDKVTSYFGMRKVSLGQDANGYTVIHLNNQPLFQFGLLDQGWWPDGLYTPPTEEAMLYDIEMTRKWGFNMLRKHVKVESSRYYYHCDKMGVLVWQDMPNGNYFTDLRIQAWDKEDVNRPLESAIQFESELKAMMDHFHNFSSILVWVPFNEGWGQYDTERVTRWVTRYDKSRLIDSPSGWTDRGVGDMIDVHLYPGPGMEPAEEKRASVLGEFGGLGHPVKDHLWWDKRNWGYLTYEDQKEFEQEFEQLIQNLKSLRSWGLAAAIYTQTTDVEGEVNGLMTYDREIVKIKPEVTQSLFSDLYKPWWNKRIIIPDSEDESHLWMVSFDTPNADWQQDNFDDKSWLEEIAPFTGLPDPFVKNSTSWNSDKMFLRKDFYLENMPEDLYIRHYMPGTNVKIFINGMMVRELEDGGGRKRHYTNQQLKEAIPYLKKGKNIIALEVTKLEENKGTISFDTGLYYSVPVSSFKLEGQSFLNNE